MATKLKYLSIILGITGLLFTPGAAAGLSPALYEPGEILIMHHSEGSGLADNAGLSAFLDRNDLTLMKVLTKHGNHNVGRYKATDSTFDPLAAARELQESGVVKAASPNYHLDLLVLPNDPMLGQQWHVQHAGDTDIDLPEAWDIALGDPSVVIAIIDTGVDSSHPDLQAAMWTNPGEIPANGIDDDANGWVDDLHGWDVGDDDADIRPGVYLEQGIDVGFHGTHCAGIAAAMTNNGTGIAGAGWGCRLMGLKTTGNGVAFTTAGITEAFDYAVANGASVISMSFGGTFQDFGFMQALVDQANAAGVVCVAAAGNSNNATPLYPAALDGVISVGATSNLNQRASFSSYGASVDLAAPGEQIWSTVQSNYEWDLLTQLLFALTFGWDGVNPYMYSDGTSMACPLVAGVCGLVLSAGPELTPADVLQLLIDTGDNLTYDQPIGVKVNAHAALEALQTSSVTFGPALFRVHDPYPNPFNPRTTIAFDLGQRERVNLRVYDLAGHLVRELIGGERFSAGRHEIVWDGGDEAGRRVASGTYFYRLEAGRHAESKAMVLMK